MSFTSKSRISVEVLEGRQFLSASAASCVTGMVDTASNARVAAETVALTPASAAIAAPVAAAPVAATTPAEQLLGTFDGQVTVKKLFLKKSFDATLVVTSVTDTGITGTFTLDGHDVEGTFPGKLNPKGSFRYRIKNDDYTVEIRGKILRGGEAIKGTARFKAFGLSVSGDMRLHKQPGPTATA